MPRLELWKLQRRRLRELCSLAYERELEAALVELDKEVRRWREGEIDAFDLNEAVHRYHQGPNRDFYKKYNWEPDFVVGAAILQGILSDEDVGAQLLEIMKPFLDVLPPPRE